MNDPLWRMSPADPDWWAEVADAAESLAVAISQDDGERRERKFRVLVYAYTQRLGMEPHGQGRLT